MYPFGSINHEHQDFTELVKHLSANVETRNNLLLCGTDRFTGAKLYRCQIAMKFKLVFTTDMLLGIQLSD